MDTVLITGGSGLVGTSLTKKLLARGYRVIIFSRNPRPSSVSNLTYAKWNPEEGEIDEDALQSADYIIHLAGAGVAEKRWSNARKKEIRQSRVKSGSLIISFLRKNTHRAKKIVSASAIGWYGADSSIPNPIPFTEDFLPSNDFLGETCQQWEQSILPATDLGIPLVVLRTGIVLSNHGGALKEFLNPLRFGFATVLGSGKQMISWIHIHDLTNMYIEAMEKKEYVGVYNAASPDPASNKRFIVTLAKQLKGRYHTTIPIPEFILKIAMGEMSIEILKSTTVSCNKIIQAGFAFEFPTLESAIEHLVTHREV
ncbi:MAG TPA: TIGR01777 family oxidoreductase [Niabella sp.]|nr:TIGR01777 family oxidoreductase [Niabella sp.]HQW13779.1 TIGR01777 family oxidoreductase [Niabella sp.]HQX19328.1 TIGR01777 family oxidoreductase [Niabella sp.]HQX40816.1 TIGR01777 family oxidoreductase [Niabella sp.]HRB06118.1 TIGR01777 family oxidoreductase [Niabella sp.]